MIQLQRDCQVRLLETRADCHRHWQIRSDLTEMLESPLPYNHELIIRFQETKQDSTGKDARVKNAHPQLKKLHRQRVESGLPRPIITRKMALLRPEFGLPLEASRI